MPAAVLHDERGANVLDRLGRREAAGWHARLLKREPTSLWVATSLVFESYEGAFRDNEIDDGVLPSLTTEALSDDVAR